MRAKRLADCFALLTEFESKETIIAKVEEDGRLIVNNTEAARALSLSYSMFSKYLREEDPRPPRNAPNKKFYMDELVHWWAEREKRKMGVVSTGHKLDPIQQRARKDKELADKAELENMVRRDQLIEADQVVAAGMDMVLRVRSRFLRVPAATAPLLLGVDDRVTIQEIIKERIDDALTELSVEWTEKEKENV